MHTVRLLFLDFTIHIWYETSKSLLNPTLYSSIVTQLLDSLFRFFFGRCVVFDDLLIFFTGESNLLILLIMLFEVNFLVVLIDDLLLGHDDFLYDLFLLRDDLHLLVVATTDLFRVAKLCGGETELAVL